MADWTCYYVWMSRGSPDLARSRVAMVEAKRRFDKVVEGKPTISDIINTGNMEYEDDPSLQLEEPDFGVVAAGLQRLGFHGTVQVPYAAHHSLRHFSSPFPWLPLFSKTPKANKSIIEVTDDGETGQGPEPAEGRKRLKQRVMAVSIEAGKESSSGDPPVHLLLLGFALQGLGSALIGTSHNRGPQKDLRQPGSNCMQENGDSITNTLKPVDIPFDGYCNNHKRECGIASSLISYILLYIDSTSSSVMPNFNIMADQLEAVAQIVLMFDSPASDHGRVAKIREFDAAVSSMEEMRQCLLWGLMGDLQQKLTNSFYENMTPFQGHVLIPDCC
ncbi:hypothetical protein FHL15_003741 [Xylaria flabelliformis]|uniref:Uncharacterized protein n=1 Tax=Xylaria flabelliformis TaxID=2512241 RepID=A0A553I5D8_9PEZI|nr:hypothetical protein FHL15_003741 [Xylaria flabelliformis]